MGLIEEFEELKKQAKTPPPPKNSEAAAEARVEIPDSHPVGGGVNDDNVIDPPKGQDLNHVNGKVETPPPAPFRPSREDWALNLSQGLKTALDMAVRQYGEGAAAVLNFDSIRAELEKQRNQPQNPGTFDPDGLSEADIGDDLDYIARWYNEKYNPPQIENNGPVKALSIIVETDDVADRINAEYLARPEVIEHLGYSQSIALIIGAKHHGKSTVTRSLALSIPRGLMVWGRRTTAGPVLYAASDDEVAATRSQLLEMGWRRGKDPLYFVHISPESDATPAQILEDIADEALRRKAIMIVLDMLFDFVGIKNELSYSETRTNIGMVQRLADVTKAFTVGAHHTPKYLTDAHEAANAALGSQGVSARFSPIILVRKYTDTLFTIESTPTRDPRGQALKPTRLVKDENGWISLGEEFKEWMKWEIYAERVLDLFQPNKGLSVSDVVQRLNIDRARAQNTLKQLESNGKLTREKFGHRYLYYRAEQDP